MVAILSNGPDTRCVPRTLPGTAAKCTRETSGAVKQTPASGAGRGRTGLAAPFVGPSSAAAGVAH